MLSIFDSKKNDVKPDSNPRIVKTGAKIRLIKNLLKPIRTFGLNQTLVDYDKDVAKIAAIQETWPQSSV